MKAITIVKPGQVEIRELEKPVIGKDEALLKPLFGGICGSDLNSYRGTNAYMAYPRIPAKTVGDPMDVGMCAAFLASDAARYISGSCIPVDGGALIGF